MPQVQHVPVAAHDGDRPGRQAGRAADPHPRDAPPRRVRHRGALAVQGDPRHRRRARPGGRASTTWRGCASCSTGSARPTDPGEFLESLRFDLGAPGGLRLHPQGRRDRAADRGRRRSTSPTPCTPRWATAASAPGSTAGWSRWSSALENGDVVEIFTSKAETAGPEPRLADLRRRRRGPGRRSRQWFAKERREEAIEEGKDAIAARCATQGLPLQRLLSARRDGRAGRASCTSRTSAGALRRGRGGARVGAARRAAAGRAARRRRRAPRRTLAEGRRRPTVRAARGARATPGSWCVATTVRRRLGQARPLLHAGARRRRSSASSPAATGSRCTARTAPTPATCTGAAGAAGRRRVGGVARPRCSSSTSRSRRSTGTGCSPTSPGCCPTSTSTSCRRRCTTSRDRVAVSPVHLRDGRPQAPRARAAGGAQRRGRLRRLPGDVSRLSGSGQRSHATEGGSVHRL